MKKIFLLMLVSMGMTSISAQPKKINLAKSQIEWKGEKVTGNHTGTINFTEGNLIFKGAKLTGGSFTVDMTSLIVTDLKAGQGKEKLEGHLKADDFFGVDNFKTSKLIFKSVKTNSVQNYTITADLTIKGITQPVTFNLVATNQNAKATFKIDRTKYDIKYRSGNFFEDLGDKMIYDEFELNVNLFY
jgi:polyisoprenoid-binding protein YceI